MAVENKRLRLIGQSAWYILLTVGAVSMLFPLVWMVSTSLKTLDQITVVELHLIPDPVAWRNYREMFNIMPLLLYLRNTLYLVGAALFGATFVCSFVAYGFARVNFPGRNILFIALLSTMMLPDVVRLIPLFVMFDSIDWTGTFLPLVVPRFLGHNPFYIFLLRQFFVGIPNELSDAARIDGSSEFGIWWRMILPMSKPALTAVTIFSFQAAWNDFLYPLVYLGPKKPLWTLTLGLYSMHGIEGLESSFHYMMAMSTLMTIPMLLTFAFGQRYFIQGVTISGLKG